MARKFKIYAGVSAGQIFFEGSRIPPLPLGGIVFADEHPDFAGRIRVVRLDRFNRDGVTPRRIFKNLRPTRVKNKANQELVNDLGFDFQQVIDYINDQANKKSNEIDVQNNGALVGGGTTINFVGGGLTTLTVSDDIITVGIGSTVAASNIVGLVTTGQIHNLDASQLTGVVGTGNLPITSLGGVNFVPGESDATPAFDLSDAHSLPYSSLTGVPTHNTTINEFEWYQQYLTPGAGFSTTGPGITSTDPPESKNPYYYGVQLKPYQEMVWTHSMSGTGAYWVGKWGGNTTYDPTQAGNVSNWERVLVFRNSNADGHHIDYAGGSLDSQGFAFVGGGTGQYTTISNNTSFMRLRYNGDNNKLEIYRGSNTPIGIATANLAEDGNPITISFAINDTNLPGITTVQYYENQTNFKFYNSNEYLENNQHDKNKGVVYYDTKVKRGEELVFPVTSGPLHVGIWNGGTGITSISNVNDKSNWSTKFRYSSEDTRWQNANTDQGKTGIDLAEDIETDSNSFAIRFDYQTEKLQLWEIDSAHDWLLATANVAVGATQTDIFFSTGSGNNQNDPPESLPSVTHRTQDYTIKSYTDSDRPGSSFYSGTKTNDVWKANRSLKPGMKINFTVPTTAGNQYWATNFEGTEDLGSGENNAYQAGEMTWRLTNQEKFTAHEDCTLNANYTAIESSSTLALPGRNMSWRYNSDNTWDIFDEDTDEVVLTGDDVLDGGDMYPYLLSVNNSDDVLSDYVQYEWDWNAPQWFIEHRDYEIGGSATTLLSKIPNAKPLKTYTQGLPTQSNGFYYLGNAVYRVTWGEKMRPGQEFSWTQLTDNSNGATKNNMVIGVLNSDSDAFTAGIRFDQTGTVKEQTDQDSGFTVSAGGTSVSTSGTSMRLQYEYGTNKLVCYSLNAGVRTKLAESTSALDGNPIYISLGGESTRIPTAQGVSVYGWETVHQPVGYYNPWNNWRIGGFPENQDLGGVGIHSTGNVLAHKNDQIWRHKDGLAPGYKMHWLTPESATNSRFGQWKTGNSTSGLTNVENTTTFWDWGWRTNTSEALFEPVGMTLNTSNSNYDGSGTPLWSDPNPGSTKISIRYHSNNSLDLFDESNSEVIMTKDANCDGNPIYISFGSGGDTNNQTQMQDDFFSGGDVGIALTSTAV